MQDALGLAVSGATPASLRAYQAALDQFRCYTGDPLASVEEALAISPAMTMGYVFKAWLNLLGTEPGGIAPAREACAIAAKLPANRREQLHVHAATLLAHGHWYEAGRVLEDLTLADPHDLLALQAGHQIDFFTGDARMLRDRVARALPAWRRDLPGYHAVLSMHAFGLEECGDYAQAERQGRTAVELEPRDGWGWHAVAHVHEMRNDPAAGAQWLGRNPATWSDGSFFAVHNWWHLALFHLEQGQHDEVLRLFDTRIATGSSVLLDLIDASAMLWRLQLRGVNVGDRWIPVADRWLAAGSAGQYAFNDMHMMMALVGAGREGAQLAVLEAQRLAMERDDDNAYFTHAVGYAATRAVHAFGQGDYARAILSLRAVRGQAHRFGGSHAQRDVLDQTLLAAAQLGGHDRLAAGLRIERLALRPRTQFAPLALAA